MWKFIKMYISSIFMCQHFASDLKVLSKDRLIRVTKDRLHEIWECTCKCECGETVTHVFASCTELFWAPLRKHLVDLKARGEKDARESKLFWESIEKKKLGGRHAESNT